jgi:hypothetical protein
MRRPAVAFLLMCSLNAAAEADTPRAPITLDVRPVLCIVDRRTPACQMDFLVAWRSTIEGDYCLFSHFETAPLKCWSEASTGRHEEARRVERSFQYWLTGKDGDDPLAAVTVEVMTTETGDRRRRRQSRHVWDIL